MEAQLTSVEAQPHEHFSAPFEDIEEEIKNGVFVRKNLGGGLNFFYFHPYLGKISYLTNMFQRGWFNH